MLKPVGRWGLLKLLVRGAMGKTCRGGPDRQLPFNRLTVRSRRFGARRVKVATDGEVLWMRLPVCFEVSPHPLMLIRPEGLSEERRQAQAAFASDAASSHASAPAPTPSSHVNTGLHGAEDMTVVLQMSDPHFGTERPMAVGALERLCGG